MSNKQDILNALINAIEDSFDQYDVSTDPAEKQVYLDGMQSDVLALLKAIESWR